MHRTGTKLWLGVRLFMNGGSRGGDGGAMDDAHESVGADLAELAERQEASDLDFFFQCTTRGTDFSFAEFHFLQNFFEVF